jgi:hypothetical protein
MPRIFIFLAKQPLILSDKIIGIYILTHSTVLLQDALSTSCYRTPDREPGNTG